MLYGVADVDTVARDTARSFGLRRADRHDVKLVLPTALPYLMTGLRLAAAVALILAITAEMVIGNPGLGRNDHAVPVTPGDAAGLYALVVVDRPARACSSTSSSGSIERRALSWHQSVRGEESPVTLVHPHRDHRRAAPPRDRATARREHRLRARAAASCSWSSGAPGGDRSSIREVLPDPVTIADAFVDTWIGPGVRRGRAAEPRPPRPSASSASIVVGIAAGTVIGLVPWLRELTRADAGVLPRGPAAGADPDHHAAARHHRHHEDRGHRLRSGVADPAEHDRGGPRPPTA